jgi:hypothetical protein
MVTKEEAKALRKRDFIPNGERVDIRTLTFRETGEYEVYQCCFPTGNDPQSGPFYCGDIADFTADVDGGGVVAVCQRHFDRIKPFVSTSEGGQ